MEAREQSKGDGSTEARESVGVPAESRASTKEVDGILVLVVVFLSIF